MDNIETAPSQPVKTYIRFEKVQRIEHIIFLLSFSLLGLTGLIQKYPASPISQYLLQALGGIEMTRQIHHVAATIMIVVSIYHIIAVLYKLMVLRVSWTMVPVIDDFRHLYEDILYYLGMRKHRAYYGRYNYAEKVEYLAVVWGTVIMAITGFMMWNPIVTTKLLPGQFIPAAKAAHGGEAVLAVLSIIIWHFYHVHLRHLNKSIFNGKMSETEMAHEHPAELAQIKAGDGFQRPPQETIRRRRRMFYPIAGMLTVFFSIGLVAFLTIETTAITTLPPAQTIEVYVPLTPTPKPTLAAIPTPTPGEGVAADSWDGTYSALFRNRCSTCHGFTNVGGLSLAAYQDALAGGNSGPGIVPGDPDTSSIVQIQKLGGHPGQLSDLELQQVIAWIAAGAVEK